VITDSRLADHDPRAHLGRTFTALRAQALLPRGHPPRTDAERPLRAPTSSTRSAPTSTESPARV